MDITNFMTWFISQVVSIFSFCFNLLDSITFMGTSLLKVILTIIILGTLLPIIFTIPQSGGNAIVNAYDSYRARKRNEQDTKNDEKYHRLKGRN